MTRWGRILPQFVLLLLVAALAPPASASNTWSDTDPIVVVMTPAGNSVSIYVDNAALGTEHLPAAQAAQMTYSVKPVNSGTSTMVALTSVVPCDAFSSNFQTRLTPSTMPYGTGTVFGVTYKDAPDASRAFIREEKASWPNVRDDRLKLAPKFGTSQLPETFVIDRTGKIVAVSRGQIDQQFMDAALARAGVPS